MEIRPLKTKEYPLACKLVQERASWMQMPPAGSLLIGKFEDGELVGVIGVQRPLVVECLVTNGKGHARDLILAMDQMLAGASPTEPYYCFVTHRGFEQLIERDYAENIEGFDGKLYVRRRDNG